MLRNPIVGFLLRFALIYGLLIAPWPGWNNLYEQYFRSLAELAFSRDGAQRIVLFERHDVQHGFSSLNTRMILGNRDKVDSNGDGPEVILDLDTRSIGWDPTALTIALILATPVPWRRRAWALLWGLILVHGLILFAMQAWIWDKSTELGLMTLSSFSQEVVNDIQYTLITQMGASFSIPVLIWILVTFRGEDYAIIKGLVSPPPPPPKSAA